MLVCGKQSRNYHSRTNEKKGTWVKVRHKKWKMAAKRALRRHLLRSTIGCAVFSKIIKGDRGMTLVISFGEPIIQDQLVSGSSFSLYTFARKVVRLCYMDHARQKKRQKKIQIGACSISEKIENSRGQEQWL